MQFDEKLISSSFLRFPNHDGISEIWQPEMAIPLRFLRYLMSGGISVRSELNIIRFSRLVSFLNGICLIMDSVDSSIVKDLSVVRLAIFSGMGMRVSVSSVISKMTWNFGFSICFGLVE